MIPAMIALLPTFPGLDGRRFSFREDLVLQKSALRRQLLALHAQQPRRRLTALHKLLWVALRTFWSGWTKPLILVTLENRRELASGRFPFVLGMGLKNAKRWMAKRVGEEVRALIFRMVAENPTWGAPRIHGELLKLGFEVRKGVSAMDPASSERSRFREAMADVPRKPSRGHCCNGFLHRPNAHVWGVSDCFLIIGHDRREDPAFQCDAKSQCTLGCTAIARSMGLPTAAQILAIRSRRKVGAEVFSAVRDMGSEPTRTAFRSPWQNGVAERWVGHGRDLLDHVIILNERHLKRLMSVFLVSTMRTGRILDWLRTRQEVVASEIRSTTESKIQSFPETGGLHHR